MAPRIMTKLEANDTPIAFTVVERYTNHFFFGNVKLDSCEQCVLFFVLMVVQKGMVNLVNISYQIYFDDHDDEVDELYPRQLYPRFPRDPLRQKGTDRTIERA